LRRRPAVRPLHRRRVEEMGRGHRQDSRAQEVNPGPARPGCVPGGARLPFFVARLPSFSRPRRAPPAMPLPITHEDYREAARRRLPRLLFDYIDGGAGEEQAMDSAREALRGVALRQRVLRDVSQVKLSTSLFGQALDMPVLLGPVGMAGMFARRGEVQAHRAALAAGLNSCLSTLSVCSVEEVARSAAQAPWFQLYMIKDRGYMRE